MVARLKPFTTFSNLSPGAVTRGSTVLPTALLKFIKEEHAAVDEADGVVGVRKE
jgi:hypothetical protein